MLVLSCLPFFKDHKKPFRLFISRARHFLEEKGPFYVIISNFGEYSRVPNKRGEGENNRGGWKWLDITIIGGLE